MSTAQIAEQSPYRDERPVDRRIARSRSAIEESLTALLVEGRSFDKLTVSEVANRAGLTRKTFYARFGSIDAVVQGMACSLFNGILLAIPDRAYALPLSKGRLIHAVTERLYEQRDTVEFLTKLCPNHLFLQAGREAVVSILFRRIFEVNDVAPISDFDRDYLMHLLPTTLHGAITAWASRGFEDSPDKVADFAAEMWGPICDRIFQQSD